MADQQQHIVLPLATLLSRLQREGFSYGVDVHLQLQTVLRNLSEDVRKNPYELKWLIAPVLAQSVEEQQSFYRVFDEYFREEIQPLLDEGYEGLQPPPPPPPPETPRWTMPRWLATTILAVCSLLVLYGLYRLIFQPQYSFHPNFEIQTENGRETATDPPYPLAYLGDSVRFVNLSNEQPDSLSYQFVWHFGEGEDSLVSSSAQVYYQYHTIGDKIARLTIRDRATGKDSSLVRPVKVACPYQLNARFNFDWQGTEKAAVPRVEDEITFTPDLIGGDTLAYYWDFGDGSQSREIAPTHVYDSVGSYSVELRILRKNADKRLPCGTEAKHEKIVSIARSVDQVSLNPIPLVMEPIKLPRSFTYWGILLLATLVGLVLFVLGMLVLATRFLWKRTHPPELDGGEEGPYDIPFPKQDSLIAADRDLYDLANRLRMRRESTTQKIDLSETIRKTIQSGGIPELAYRQTYRSSEYLFLIEQNFPENHLLRLFDRLLDVLDGEDVVMEVFYYDSDIQVCWREGEDYSIKLSDLAQQYRQARLVVMSDGYHFLNPYEAKMESWVSESLQAWTEEAILLTPIPVGDWGYKERLLRDFFAILPIDLQGQLAMVDKFNADQLPDFETLQKDLERVIPNESESLQPYDLNSVAGLKDYLGGSRFQWVAATMIYPYPNWNLTLAIGKALSLDSYLLTYENLLHIGRIPWMQDGDISKKLRLALLDELLPGNERLARETVVEMIQLAEKEMHQDAFAKRKSSIQELTNKFFLDPSDERVAREVNRLWEHDMIADPVLRQQFERSNSNFSQKSPVAYLEDRYGLIRPREVAGVSIIGLVLFAIFSWFINQSEGQGDRILGWTERFPVLEDSTFTRTLPVIKDSAAFWNNRAVRSYEAMESRDSLPDEWSGFFPQYHWWKRAMDWRERDGFVDSTSLHNVALTNYNVAVHLFEEKNYSESGMAFFDAAFFAGAGLARTHGQKIPYDSEKLRELATLDFDWTAIDPFDANAPSQPIYAYMEKVDPNYLDRLMRIGQTGRVNELLGFAASAEAKIFEAWLEDIAGILDSIPASNQRISLLEAMHGWGLSVYYLAPGEQANREMADLVINEIEAADSTFFLRYRPNLKSILNAPLAACEDLYLMAERYYADSAYSKAIWILDSVDNRCADFDYVKELSDTLRARIGRDRNEADPVEKLRLAMADGDAEFALGNYRAALDAYNSLLLEIKKNFGQFSSAGRRNVQEIQSILVSKVNKVNVALRILGRVQAAEVWNEKLYLFGEGAVMQIDLKTGKLDADFPKSLFEAFPRLGRELGENIEVVVNNGQQILFSNGKTTYTYSPTSQNFSRVRDYDGVDITAAYSWSRNATWFLHGNETFKLAKSRRSNVSALFKVWKNLPRGWETYISAAFSIPNTNKVYFIKSNEYIRLDQINQSVDRGYPRSVEQNLMKDILGPFVTNTTTSNPVSTITGVSKGRLIGASYEALVGKRTSTKPKMLIRLATTATPTLNSTVKFLNNPKSAGGGSVGYHAMIGRDGEIVQMIPLNEWAYTWGRNVKSYNGISGNANLSEVTIGIGLINIGQVTPNRGGGFESRYSNLEIPASEVVLSKSRGSIYWQNYPPAQIKALENLLEMIGKNYEIDTLLANRDLKTTPDVSMGPEEVLPVQQFKSQIYKLKVNRQSQGVDLTFYNNTYEDVALYSRDKYNREILRTMLGSGKYYRINSPLGEKWEIRGTNPAKTWFTYETSAEKPKIQIDQSFDGKRNQTLTLDEHMKELSTAYQKWKRYQKLLSSGAVSQADFDEVVKDFQYRLNLVNSLIGGRTSTNSTTKSGGTTPATNLEARYQQLQQNVQAYQQVQLGETPQQQQQQQIPNYQQYQQQQQQQIQQQRSTIRKKK